MPSELKEMTSLFEAGQADIIAVLTTQNNLLQERRIYLDLLNQLAQSAATLIQATGLPPNRVIFMPSVTLLARHQARARQFRRKPRCSRNLEVLIASNCSSELGNQ